MNDSETIERILEALEETCFPLQVDWNKKDLYVKGLQKALRDCGLTLTESDK